MERTVLLHGLQGILTHPDGNPDCLIGEIVKLQSHDSTNGLRSPHRCVCPGRVVFPKSPIITLSRIPAEKPRIDFRST